MDQSIAKTVKNRTTVSPTVVGEWRSAWSPIKTNTIESFNNIEENSNRIETRPPCSTSEYSYSYYPYGMVMDERHFVSEGLEYRYGFNGKELDKPGMGGGQSTYDYGFRIYNPAIAKFLSVDPLSFNYPAFSAYSYAANCPITFIDFMGMGPINPCPDAGCETIIGEEATQGDPINGTTSVWESGGCTWVWMFNAQVSLTINRGELTETAQQKDAPGQLDFTINSQLYEGIYYSNNLVSQGLNIVNGVIIEGRSSPGTFYMSLDYEGNWSFGAGDPPKNSALAFGGGVPMIVNDMPYGEQNLYSEGVPSGAPIDGPVASSYMPYLVQKSSGGYPSFNNETVGKTIVGYNSNTCAFIICVQENNVKGLTLDVIKSYYQSWGFNNVLAFDGSSSATLVQDQQILVEPADYKDSSTPCGITFSVKK
jgi:RHS repeat-associated protein